MSATEVMQSGRIKPQVDRQYALVRPFQWVRETFVNAYQAKATKVQFGIEPVSDRDLKISRRVIRDNGVGMEPETIKLFLNRYGGSGHVVDPDSNNYGYGSKVSLLPWNPNGVVVISRGASSGLTSMLWMHLDTEVDEYGARMFDISDSDSEFEDWSAVVPLDEFESFPEGGVDWVQVAKENLPETGSGTAVVLLGSVGHPHTVLGDPSRGESDAKYGIDRYLNSRFYDLKTVVTVETYTDQSGDVSEWAGRSFQARYAKGLQKVIEDLQTPSKRRPDRGLVGSGVFKVDSSADLMDTSIHWMLFSAAEMTSGGSESTGAIATPPLVGVMHEAHDGLMEILNLTAYGMKNQSAARARMARFVAPESVMKRMLILIHPKKKSDLAYVFPTASRDELKYADPNKGGVELPWDVWYDQWKRHKPAEVQAAENEYYESMSRGTDRGGAHLQALGQTYLPYLQSETKRLVASPQGTIRSGGVPTGNHSETPSGGSSGGSSTPKRKKSSDTPGEDGGLSRQVSRRVGIVRPSTEMVPEEWLSVRYAPQDHAVFINQASEDYKRVVKFIMDQHEARGNITADPEDPRRTAVEVAIRYAIEDHIALSTTESVIIANAHPKNKEEILSSYALSASLRGISHINQLANGKIGAALKGQKVK